MANKKKDIKTTPSSSKKAIPKRRGRPKKRGRKPARKRTPKKPKQRRKGGSSEYFKVYKRLKKYFSEKKIIFKDDKLRLYATLVFNEIKERYKSKKSDRFRVTSAILEDFFGQSDRILKKIFSKLGVPFSQENFLFWMLPSEINDLDDDTYVEIDLEFIGEKDWEIGKASEINTSFIIRRINVWISKNPVKLPDKYLWFTLEKTADGYYLKLIFDSDLNEEQRGEPAPEMPRVEKREEPKKEEKPKEEEAEKTEKVRKAKAEADKAEEEKKEAEIKKLKTMLDTLYGELKDVINIIKEKKKAKLKTDRQEKKVEEIEDEIDDVENRIKKLK